MELSEQDLARAAKLDQVSHRLFDYFGEPDWHDPLPAVDELVCTILSKIPTIQTVTSHSEP